jgi:single-stranded DNA-binding protein
MAYEDNDRNITGINLNNIVGTAGGPVEYKFDGQRAELSVAVNQGYKKGDEWVDTGTAWVRVTASGGHAEDHWPPVNKGDKVRLDGGRLEVREFDRADGTKGLSLQVVFGELTVIQAKSEGGYIPAEGEEAF